MHQALWLGLEDSDLDAERLLFDGEVAVAVVFCLWPKIWQGMKNCGDK